MWRAEGSAYLGAHMFVVILQGKALLRAGSQDLCNRITFSPVHSCCFSISATCPSHRKTRSAQPDCKQQGRFWLKSNISGQKNGLLKNLLKASIFQETPGLNEGKGKTIVQGL